MVEKQSTVCGSTIFVKVKAAGRKGLGEKRAPKKNATPETVMEVNQRRAERELSMLLNHNFAGGDFHLVLSYREEPPADEARKYLYNFQKTCGRDFKKQGKIFKCITATEYLNVRKHHHVVCSQMDVDRLRKIWKHGFVIITPLDQSGDYRKLAHYIIKETSKTFRDPDACGKRRYNCSRSIERPVTKSEEVSPSMLFKDPAPIKDYYIDRDSIVRGVNPFTGMPYIEYVMIANDVSAPRLSFWRRGRPVKRPETYGGLIKQCVPKQLSFGTALKGDDEDDAR